MSFQGFEKLAPRVRRYPGCDWCGAPEPNPDINGRCNNCGAPAKARRLGGIEVTTIGDRHRVFRYGDGSDTSSDLD